MAMPGFNAGASLVKTSSQYRSASARLHRTDGGAESQVVASYIQQHLTWVCFRFCHDIEYVGLVCYRECFYV
jgi:hypothetical protein